MRGTLRTVRGLVSDYCLRPLWRCLMTYGSLHVTPVPPDPFDFSIVEQFVYVTTSWLAPVRYAQHQPARLAGPRAGHPERVRPDVPLTERERLLDLEVWSAQRPHRTQPPRRSQRRRGRSAR
ncbi:DUF6059 family protein [Streptomyces sp. NPDC052040]|uniref:DUF6059 family protein n=1 Tax=Streptomyces sp. NPDC052040 TaxID=3365682 RepID=UPI0037D1FBAD